MESVKVVVRCRPMNQREKDLHCKEVVTVDSSRGQCFIQKPDGGDEPPKLFTFDGAYYINHCTEQIYNEIAYPLVEGVTEGYNGTIFAYGQTGSGKSFSMQGIPDPPTQRGIIPRAFEHIFESIQCAENTKFLVRASYLEIYNEEVRDLLGEDTKQKLELKEHPEFGVYVKSLSMHTVHSVAECEQIMEMGWRNRSVGYTLMNKDSSRSHSIFTINMEICSVDDQGKDSLRAGKLNLVDLAGSERQSKTGATGDRLKEATKINLSLSALGNVISALVDGKCKHIPYRDSKLTRLLQDSLGGNTKTLMVACLSPADNNYDETLSTLRYANRAKNIKNKPRINEDPKDALLREYQEEIKKLKDLLTKQMAGNNLEAVGPERKSFTATVIEANVDMEVEKQMIRQEYEEKFAKLKADFEAEKKSRTQLEEHIDILRTSYNRQVECTQEDLKRQEVTVSSIHTLEDEIPEASRSPVSLVPGESAETEQESSAQDPEQSRSTIQLLPSANSVLKPVPVQPQVAKHIQSVKRESPETVCMTSSAVSQAAATTDAAQLSTTLDHQLVLARLAVLEQEVVGGEQAKNKDLREKHKRRKKYADERKRELVAALKNVDDESSDQVLLNVYESIHEELQAKSKILEKIQRRLKAADVEINDLQSEFEHERIDYLGTIRKLEQESQLFRQILEQIQPLIRRDCNYSNLDKIKREAFFDEELGYWKIPDIVVHRTSLPLAGQTLSQTKLGRKASSAENGENLLEEDRYKQMLSRSDSENIASNYFKSKRASQILSADHMRSLVGQKLLQTSAENGQNSLEEDLYKQILSQSQSTTIVRNYIETKRAGQVVSAIHTRSLALQISAQAFTTTLTDKSSSMSPNQEIDIFWPRPFRLEPLEHTALPTKSKKKKKKASHNRVSV